jgi:hypothetical protein
MKATTVALALTAGLFVVAGCNGGGGQLPPPTSSATPPPPAIMSNTKKAANNGGGAVNGPVGAAPSGSGFQTGPPPVGGKGK